MNTDFGIKFRVRRFIRWLWGWQSPYECYWRDRALQAEKALKDLRKER